jgi:hypothetical protein
MAPNLTKKNHYVPCFYSEFWAGDDRRLCEFSRPYGCVIPRRTSPKGTGYSIDLYTENALPPQLSTYLEDRFLRTVDQQASEALKLIRENRIDDLTLKQRSGWTRFLMSLLQRSPNKIADLRKKWAEEYENFSGEEVELKYQELKTENDPATLAEYLRNPSPEILGRGHLKLFQSVMDLPQVGSQILNMNWGTFRIKSRFSLLTSDRPIIMSNGIGKKEGHIGLPIGPDALFLCANEMETIKNIAQMPADDFARHSNLIVATQAERLVFGKNDKALQFVEKHLRKRT